MTISSSKLDWPCQGTLSPPNVYSALLYIRLYDILHQDQKLYLVFEFVDMDLKKYMDTVGNAADGMSEMMVKVSCRCRIGRCTRRLTPS